MNRLDLAIMILVLFFAGIGMLRGGLREAASLMIWAVSIAVAWLFSRATAGWFTWTSGLMLRRVTAFSALFAATFVVVTVVVLVLRLLFFASSPGVMGRVAGAVLGALRGLAVVVVLVLLAGITSFPRKPWWRESFLAPYFQSAAVMLRSQLPLDEARQFRFGSSVQRSSMDFSGLKSHNTRFSCTGYTAGPRAAACGLVLSRYWRGPV